MSHIRTIKRNNKTKEIIEQQKKLQKNNKTISQTYMYSNVHNYIVCY